MPILNKNLKLINLDGIAYDICSDHLLQSVYVSFYFLFNTDKIIACNHDYGQIYAICSLIYNKNVNMLMDDT